MDQKNTYNTLMGAARQKKIYKPTTLRAMARKIAPKGEKEAWGEFASTVVFNGMMMRFAGLSDKPLRHRLEQKLIKKVEEVIIRRNLSVPTGWREEVKFLSMKKGAGLILIRYSGWYEYGRNQRRQLGAGYLYGIDDGQAWAVRVPSTMKNVGESLAWLKPSVVKRAEAEGRQSRRQGDIYFVEKAGKSDFRSIEGTRHRVKIASNGGISVTHPQHSCLRLSGKISWMAVQQTQINGSGRKNGD